MNPPDHAETAFVQGGLTASGSAGIASGHAVAAQAGIRALHAGGTAVDAALAAAFTQWVVNAPQCGPGGEMVVLVTHHPNRDTSNIDTGTANHTSATAMARAAEPAEPEVHIYGGWSRAPLTITQAGTTSLHGIAQASGPHNAVVPGSLRGAEAAWLAHGHLGWDELFAGALEAASGHEVTPRLAGVYRLVASRGHTEALQRLIGTRQPPEAGTTIKMPTLASTLATVSSGGADAFYQGRLADNLVAAARRDGALLSHDDLNAMEAVQEQALRFDLGDIIVWVPGAPSQAAITPRLLAAISASVEPDSQLFAETVAPLTQQQLTEFCAVGPTRLNGTAVSTAADHSGMSATVVHSLAGVQFGTGWVAGNTGVAFSNRVGTALSDRADLPGCNLRPGAVLPHTLSAAHVQRKESPDLHSQHHLQSQHHHDHRDRLRHQHLQAHQQHLGHQESHGHHGNRDRRGHLWQQDWMTLATPGGDRQVQWLAQAIQRFRCGTQTDEIAAGPRWFVCPVGDRFGVPVGIDEPWYTFAEPGIQWHSSKRMAGYEVRTTNNMGGGLQVVTGTVELIPTLEFASDPRAAGAALTCD